uniref:Uncharacterized protein n=1 Tax=Gouania willdenowi TaxID=441366 RepID=A0A8C5GEQ8_GOUWI
MEAKRELENILERIWTKLQGLPEADPLEVGAFIVIIVFVGKKSAIDGNKTKYLFLCC